MFLRNIPCRFISWIHCKRILLLKPHLKICVVSSWRSFASMIIPFGMIMSCVTFFFRTQSANSHWPFSLLRRPDFWQAFDFSCEFSTGSFLSCSCQTSVGRFLFPYVLVPSALTMNRKSLLVCWLRLSCAGSPSNLHWPTGLGLDLSILPYGPRTRLKPYGFVPRETELSSTLPPQRKCGHGAVKRRFWLLLSP